MNLTNLEIQFVGGPLDGQARTFAEPRTSYRAFCYEKADGGILWAPEVWMLGGQMPKECAVYWLRRKSVDGQFRYTYTLEGLI